MKQFSAFICVAAMVLLAIMIVPQTMGQTTSLTITVSPVEFEADHSVDVTVIVQDQNGAPVAGVPVIIYEAEQSRPDPSTAWLANGTTGVDGSVIIQDVTPRHGDENVFVRATYTTASGPWAEQQYDISSNSSWLDQICFFGAMTTAIIFLVIMLILIIGTLVFWKKYTYGKAQEFDSGSLTGGDLKFGNAESSVGNMTHIDGSKIFAEWKASVLANKDAMLFLPKNFLNQMKLVSFSRHYGGIMSADEEIEYPSEDTINQKLSESYKIHQNPKPVPPVDFTNTVQHYPISERTIPCTNCSDGKVRCGECEGSGKVACPPCSGKGKIPCPSCRGNGYTACGMCGGMGKKSEQQGSGQDVTKVVDSNGREVRRYTTQYHTSTTSVSCSSCGGSGNRTCGKCKGAGGHPCTDCGASGLIPCGNCGATGRVTCQVCGGTANLRELRRKIWTYKHETLRHPVGEVGGIERFGRIKATSRIMSANELAKPETALLEGLDSSAHPQPSSLAKTGLEAHEKWKAREKGKLIMAKHEMQVVPVTTCAVQYPDKGKPQSFTIWGIGSPKGWALAVKDMPSKVSMRLVGRHVLAMLLLVVEMFVLVYAFLIAGWFW
jgi:hypothetical protein